MSLAIHLIHTIFVVKLEHLYFVCFLHLFLFSFKLIIIFYHFVKRKHDWGSDPFFKAAVSKSCIIIPLFFSFSLSNKYSIYFFHFLNNTSLDPWVEHPRSVNLSMYVTYMAYTHYLCTHLRSPFIIIFIAICAHWIIFNKSGFLGSFWICKLILIYMYYIYIYIYIYIYNLECVFHTPSGFTT